MYQHYFLEFFVVHDHCREIQKTICIKFNYDESLQHVVWNVDHIQFRKGIVKLQRDNNTEVPIGI